MRPNTTPTPQQGFAAKQGVFDRKRVETRHVSRGVAAFEDQQLSPPSCGQSHLEGGWPGDPTQVLNRFVQTIQFVDGSRRSLSSRAPATRSLAGMVVDRRVVPAIFPGERMQAPEMPLVFAPHPRRRNGYDVYADGVRIGALILESAGQDSRLWHWRLYPPSGQGRPFPDRGTAATLDEAKMALETCWGSFGATS